ncbi:hypothetical protein L1987_33045 [Smallanthus sonchifolius]|uniref:Uncharacterized protein n=1 Tax=Smallanthus sonchifolius TaxID=185202 RepID=A0ACB9HPP6_9ASTR|nr:hypothetical protein L1987_33045 [Smallanthus sonchifolius]
MESDRYRYETERAIHKAFCDALRSEGKKSRALSRSSTKIGISIMDHKPLMPSSLGLRAMGKGSGDGKPATAYKAPIRYREGYHSQVRSN